ncbi:MarR family winged helix-turn-helix transcriptional regulator [uncultured Ruegeria sp.]|uniref:MarR family winged helix-turn-helix transcriptional regulator n=1 Tax=uncultured Ruegeria sp. TaxID=259304 RepID=UPI00260191E6|nr:MarR family winged helix-turn-helix transcriptional regulator [uncultured Ruegeria sp.]
MNQRLTTSRIDTMRSAARHIVRELGFMQKGLAGTDLSPSAVHTIIELGYGKVDTASDLGALLHLEKSSISRLVQKLEKDGLITAQPDPGDMRSRTLSLTEKGRALLRDLEGFGRRQIGSALDNLSPKAVDQIEIGLKLFAQSLDTRDRPTDAATRPIEVRERYYSGVIASVALLHATFYSQHYGFGAVFERKVATEMSEFMGRIDNPGNTTFSAYMGDDLMGSVSLDGEDLGEGAAHLRWFIVNPRSKGLGIGNLLLGRATAFVDSAGFDCTRLWTFRGLDAARHLYEKHGFELVHETPGTQWGTEVFEQEFVRQRGA